MADTDDLVALLSSTVLVLLGIVLQSISQLTERVVIARWFSPAVYGEVALTLAIATIATSVSLVGLNQGIPRYVSRYEDERDIRGVWLVAILGAGTVSLLSTIVVYLNVDWIAATFFGTSPPRSLLLMVVATIPLNVLLLVGVGTLRGLENTRYKLYAKDILAPGSRLLLLVVMLALGVGLNAVGYAYLASAVICLVVTHYFVDRLFPLLGSVRTHVRELVTYSAPLVVTMLLTVLLAQTDTLMVGYFRDSTEVGLYNVAYPLANSLLLVVSAFGYLYLPQVSRMDADGDGGDVGDFYRLIAKWGYVLTFPAFLLFVAFPENVISLFFGLEYAPAGVALAILSVGFFTSAAAGRNRSTLVAFGDNLRVLAADAVTITLNVALNLFLIPRYGFVGAAVATTTSFAAQNLVVSAILYVRYDITPFSRAVVVTYVSLPVILLPVTFALATQISLSLLTLPVFLVVAGLACLAVVALTGSVQAEDAILLTFVEDAVGVDLAAVRRYVPGDLDE